MGAFILAGAIFLGAWFLSFNDSTTPAELSLLMLGLLFIFAIQGIVALFSVTKKAFRFNVALLFALLAILSPLLSGISGVLSLVMGKGPQLNLQYVMMSHMHFLIFGTVLNALFGGLYFWFPNAFGKVANLRLSIVHLALYTIGFFLMGFALLSALEVNLPETFTFPVGLFPAEVAHLVMIGCVLSIVGVFMGVLNLMRSAQRGNPAEVDLWDGRSLEWSLPLPVPSYNFGEVPQVKSGDAFWQQKQSNLKAGYGYKPSKPMGKVRVPQSSFWPIVFSLGCFLVIKGIAVGSIFLIGGCILIFVGCMGTAFQPL